MSKRIFSRGEIENLLQNEHVVRCSAKSITYTLKFKKQAVEQYEQGKAAREVFTEAGFDLSLIGKDVPTECLKRWRRSLKKYGVIHRKRGRPKKLKNLSPEEKIKRLEAEVKYLKAENDFLARRRARQHGRN